MGKKIIYRVIILLAIFFLAFALIRSSIFDIKRVVVYGQINLTEEQIIVDARVPMGTNIFTFKKDEVVLRLKTNPYLKNVKISRKFPSMIVIEIEERVETAAVLFTDYYVIVDAEGMVLRTAIGYEGFTVIKGFEIEDFNKGELLEVSSNESFEIGLEVIEQMTENDLFFNWVDMTDYTHIEINIFDELMCKVTSNNLVYDIKVLKSIIYDLYNKGVNRGTINIGKNGYFTYSPID